MSVGELIEWGIEQIPKLSIRMRFPKRSRRVQCKQWRRSL